MSVPELPAEAAPPRPPAADMKASTFGILPDNGRDSLLPFHHGLKEMPSAASVRAKDLAGVLTGNETLGNHLKRMIVAIRTDGGEYHGGAAMGQHPAQAHRVEFQHALEEPL